jgi:hypothetical protein
MFLKLDPDILKKQKGTQRFESGSRYSKKIQKNKTFRKLDPGILKKTQKNTTFQKLDPDILKKHKRTQRFRNWIQIF